MVLERFFKNILVLCLRKSFPGLLLLSLLVVASLAKAEDSAGSKGANGFTIATTTGEGEKFNQKVSKKILEKKRSAKDVEAKKLRKRKGSVHEHGKASLKIAIQDLKGRIELRLPMESLVGFEKKPKSAKEIEAYDQAMVKLSSEISRIVYFEDRLNCDIKKEMVERTEDQHSDEDAAGVDHSDVFVEYSFVCQEKVDGSFIRIDFSKSFKRVKKAEVSLISGMLQKSGEYLGSELKLDVKE